MDLQLALVAGSAVTYLTSVFTRDAFLAFGAFLAFYLFIFAPTYFAGAIVDESDAFDVFFYVPASAAIYGALGFATSKLFDVGQLVDVWQTGSGGGPRSREELNVPFMAVAFVMLFFTVFFGVATDRFIDSESFLGGRLTLTAWQAGLLAGMFAALTLAAIIASGVQNKRGARFKGIHDWASVVYLLVWLIVLVGALLAWYLISDPITAGWVAAAVGGVLLIVGLLVGIAYERYRDQTTDSYETSDNKRVYTRQGRMYATGESWLYLGLRGFFMVALFVATFGVAGHAVDATSGDGDAAVANLFWYPWMVFWPVVTTLVFAMVYVCLYVGFKMPMADYPIDGDEGESLLDDVEGVVGGVLGADDNGGASAEPEMTDDIDGDDSASMARRTYLPGLAKTSASRRRAVIRSSSSSAAAAAAAATKKTLDLSNMRF